MRRAKPMPPANRQPERVRPIETSTARARATLPVHGPLSLDRESACRNRKDKLPVAVDSAHQLTFPAPAAQSSFCGARSDVMASSIVRWTSLGGVDGSGRQEGSSFGA